VHQVTIIFRVTRSDLLIDSQSLRLRIVICRHLPFADLWKNVSRPPVARGGPVVAVGVLTTTGIDWSCPENRASGTEAERPPRTLPGSSSQ